MTPRRRIVLYHLVMRHPRGESRDCGHYRRYISAAEDGRAMTGKGWHMDVERISIRTGRRS